MPEELEPISNDIEHIEVQVDHENVERDVDSDVQVEEDVSKKPDNELIEEYLKSSARCIMCSTPIWSVKLNKAYMDGATFAEMIERFSSKFEERTGRGLNKSSLHRHFKEHFDVRAAAIAQYNKNRNSSSVNPSNGQRDIFKIAVEKHVDELNLYDVSLKELINKYQEIDEIITSKRDLGKTFEIEDLILKATSILETINKQALSKFKALSKVDLESKQGQFLSQLGWLSNTMLPGSNRASLPKVETKDMETLYLSAVINQVVGRANEAVKSTFNATPDDQKVFMRELKKSMAGVADAIKIDFDNRIEQHGNEKQRLLEKKNDIEQA